MAATYGILGKVTSWSGTFVADLIGTSNSPATFTLNQVVDTSDVTRFVTGSGGARIGRNIPGLKSWSGTISCQLATPRIGNAGLVTYSSGYVANVKSFNISLNADSTDTTVFASTDPTWKSFTPGIVRWSGSYETFLDSATAPHGAGMAAEPAAASFALVDDAGSTADKILAGNVITQSLGISVAPASISTANYAFVGDDQPTVTGTYVGGIMTDPGGGVYSITTPIAGAMVLQSYTSQTFSGSAFWTSISFKCEVGQPITVDINFQGTGPLTGPSGY
ncbi:MAG: hypothetical protein KF678_03485 [Phycisphaeraceae bacterium]|nr:hypothetical protein [Phycisphaeraceae bacterium]